MLAFCCFNPVLLLYLNSFSWDETIFCCEETASCPSIHGGSQTPKENFAGLKNLSQPIKHLFNSTAQLGSDRMGKVNPESAEGAEPGSGRAVRSMAKEGPQCQQWTITKTSPHSTVKCHCDLLSQQMSCCRLESILGTGKGSGVWRPGRGEEQLCHAQPYNCRSHRICLCETTRCITSCATATSSISWGSLLLSLHPSLRNSVYTDNCIACNRNITGVVEGDEPNLSGLEMWVFP